MNMNAILSTFLTVFQYTINLHGREMVGNGKRLRRWIWRNERLKSTVNNLKIHVKRRITTRFLNFFLARNYFKHFSTKLDIYIVTYGWVLTVLLGSKVEVPKAFLKTFNFKSNNFLKWGLNQKKCELEIVNSTMGNSKKFTASWTDLTFYSQSKSRSKKHFWPQAKSIWGILNNSLENPNWWKAKEY